MTDLSEFSNNVYSQFGEDGVIKEILNRISQHVEMDKWCVEFGAWDGVYLSNTCRLIREEKYNAVLIEGDKAKAKELEKNLPQKNVHKICKFVTFEGENSLDNILLSTPIPSEFDFLSIDVDGVDYYIFESLEKFRPKIVCIEFNMSIPNAVQFVQPKDFNVKQGSSAWSLCRLARKKGYSLVGSTYTNLFFVRDDLAGFVNTVHPSLEQTNPRGNDVAYLFVGYDGSLLSNKEELLLLWHRVYVPFSKLQFLPKFLRVYRGDYGFFKKGIFYFLCILRRLRVSK